MTKPTTPAQRRIIAAADPVTGRLTGTDAQLTALVRLQLAFRHPRPPHAYFLTPAGHRVRDEPAGAAPETAPVEPVRGVFAARTGTEEAPLGEDGPARAREVRDAWLGLVEMRRMTNPDGDRERPCAWERAHLTQAAAIALEAAGRTPARPGREGYRVTATEQPDAVAVREPTAEGVRACGTALERAGWQVSEHAEARTGRRYALASPRRA
ncbi:hypothetical protein ABT390_23365 [Streptomyces aurantiacus]|uniref:Uncharacterized protein n=1 Tax=Streptomyces aurantiacus JA 4570 TaxID=1286094 RepID=S3ZUF2_9ACTN|nr:hypothetical protein [Streptomyces aurantiacus]EPH46424.1 hypothetical protein STRAU_0396 [Streptomyces aurantiacus JA 4570]